MTLPEELYTAAQVREFDRIAIEQHAIAGYELMRRAGAACFHCLRRHWPAAEKILIVCGPGNNGGDGYVLARLCRQSGLTVQVLALTDPQALTGDALSAWRDAVAAGVAIDCGDDMGILADADVIVDALFGTGLQRPLEGAALRLVTAINRSAAAVLAVDIPSGLYADFGVAGGGAVEADVTLTFIALKQGLFSGQAGDYCGQVEFADLDVPYGVYRRHVPAALRYDGDDHARLLPPRRRVAHKGHYGHVLAVGGGLGHSGAIAMCAEAAARVGAGLVSVAAPAASLPLVCARRPELMCFGVDQAKLVEPLLERATVLALGPGLGTSAWAQDVWNHLVDSDKPLVLDADGLNLLAERPLKKNNWILTPHPGEAGRLLACGSKEIEADRYTAVRRLQQRYGGVVILKGHGTLICADDGKIYVVNRGNPGMASGGVGDVLTGVIAGLLAQGFALPVAARLGVWVHGKAADTAALDGERGMLATDLMPHLRRWVNP